MRKNVQGHMPDRAWSKANVQRVGEIFGGMQGKINSVSYKRKFV